MNTVVGRVHFRDTKTHASDYSGSPHVVSAIVEGKLAVCHIVTDRITSVEGEVTCIGCLTKIAGTHRVIRIADGKRVDYEEVMAIRARRKEINDLAFDEIEWYRDGKPMTIDPAKLEEFKFIGLSNFDFLTYEITSLTSVDGVQINSVKI